MIVNKKIATYSNVIKVLYIASILISLLIVISQGVDRAVTGQWRLWQDISIGNRLSNDFDENLISGYLIGIMSLSVVTAAFMYEYCNRFALRIDIAKIFECVDKNTKKIILIAQKDYLIICVPILLDVIYAFFFSMFNSAFLTNGYFAIIFGRYLGSYIGAHLCSYITIIFYALCCKEKKKELSKDLALYLVDEKKKMLEKQHIEKIANDKTSTQQLLEQCGMKFFLKYYKTLLRLPVRDIEIDENYTSEEKTERLTAAKSLIEQGFSKYAAQHIVDNYADLLTNDEKVTANEILSKQ